MTDEFDTLPFPVPEARPATGKGTVCRHAKAHRTSMPEGGWICRCGWVVTPEAVRRGRRSRSRGNAIERWVNRMLGIVNRGKYGGPEDGGGEGDWIAVQTKSGGYYPATIDRWLRMVPARAGQMQGVVLVDTPGPGKRRRALLVVDLYQAAQQWGGGIVEEDAA